MAVSCSDDGTLKTWDLVTGKPKRTLAGHRAEVWVLALLPDDQHVLSGARDGILTLWHLHSASAVKSIGAHDEAVTRISLSANGDTAVTCSYDNTMKAWEIPSCTLINTFSADDSFLSAAALTHDGRFAVGGTMEGTLLIFDLQARKPPRRLVALPEPVEHLVVIPNQYKALSCGLNHDRICLWDLDQGQMLKSFGTDGYYYDLLAVSADGQRVVATCTDTYRVALEVWRLDESELVTNFTAFHEDRVSSHFAFAKTTSAR